MLLTVYVHPNAATTRLGGSREIADGRGVTTHALRVWVKEPAANGRATRAVIEAVAHALDIRLGRVSLVSGATARVKRLHVPDDCADRVRKLLDE